MTDQVVDRLHRLLVDRLRERPDPSAPVRVSHVYDDLVPYGAVRSELGVELKADYEHALLRLLAGELGLLHLEPEAAREALHREVESPYPAVDLYRKFSSSRARVTLPAAEPAEPGSGPVDAEGEPEGGGEPEAAEPLDDWAIADPAEEWRGSAVGDRDVGAVSDVGADSDAEQGSRPPAHTEATPTTAPPADAEEAAPGRCGFCDAALPAGREVRYCPFCGGDQRLRPCPGCDTPLSPDWRYCIGCGREVGA